MYVKNLISKRSGRKVPNQFIIIDDKSITFQSYETWIFTLRGKQLEINSSAFWYSTTTSKYLKQALDEYAPSVDFYKLKSLLMGKELPVVTIAIGE